MKRNSLRAYLSRISVFSQLPHFSDGPGTNRRSTHRRLIMKSRILKRTCIAAMLLLVLGVASSAWAAGYSGGVPWQVGDVVICFGSGTCNVVRIVNGSPVLLDQISDLAQPSAIPPIPGVTNPGGTRGVAINNTLHAVVTDNGSGTGSNVVVYSIARMRARFSMLPFITALLRVLRRFVPGASEKCGNCEKMEIRLKYARNEFLFIFLSPIISNPCQSTGVCQKNASYVSIHRVRTRSRTWRGQS